MAFDITNFASEAIFNSNQPRIWRYTTTDTAAVVDSAGYFNTVADMVNVGDIVKANVDTDGTPGYGEFYVSANDGTTVDVNDIVSIVTSTDTD